MLKRYFSLLVIMTTLFLSLPAHATIVRITTSLGEIDVNLYDELTPITVENFLSYIETQAYDNSFIHRSIPGFIVQGGGFSYVNETDIQNINTNAAINNEPFFSNIRGTIAMAKIGSDPNSATSQWFFNLSNNSGSLDSQNGGFTVFGEVMLDDMDVVDAIAQLNIFNLGGAFSDTPLRDYTSEDSANQVTVTDENLVVISSIEVIDDAVDTFDGTVPAAAVSSSSGGGGVFGFGIFILLLSMATFRDSSRQFERNNSK